MTLPDLGLQIAYGHVAWALVLVALLTACVPHLARRHWRAVAAGLVVLGALPGSWSPAWWLTLAFQYPSGLLVGLSLVALERRRQAGSTDSGALRYCSNSSWIKPELRSSNCCSGTRFSPLRIPTAPVKGLSSSSKTSFRCM